MRRLAKINATESKVLYTQNTNVSARVNLVRTYTWNEGARFAAGQRISAAFFTSMQVSRSFPSILAPAIYRDCVTAFAGPRQPGDLPRAVRSRAGEARYAISGRALEIRVRDVLIAQNLSD